MDKLKYRAYNPKLLPTWNTKLTLSDREAPQGESTGVCLVKLESNWLVSSSEARTGLKGGSSFLEMTSAHLMCLKKGWVLIGSASAAPLPRRWEICRFKNFLSVTNKNDIHYDDHLLYEVSSIRCEVGGQVQLPLQDFFDCFFPAVTGLRK